MYAIRSYYAVAYLAERDRLRARLLQALRPVRDLERILAKVARPGATPRDLAALRDSLEGLPGVAGRATRARQRPRRGTAGPLRNNFV